jgi:Nucleotide modification associated domain 2
MYVVDRDFGFAPNPFHGYCTLATCKPHIRKGAMIGDWVMGMGGRRLGAKGQCIFAMLVTEKVTFDEYWGNPVYLDKKPVRNGSNKMMVGDNIYHRDGTNGKWNQENSHHSNVDGSVNLDNLEADTKTDTVLLSRHFFYFGSHAPEVAPNILASLGFANSRGHRVFDIDKCDELLSWLQSTYGAFLNVVQGDPFDFSDSHRRYSARNNKIS